MRGAYAPQHVYLYLWFRWNVWFGCVDTSVSWLIIQCCDITLYSYRIHQWVWCICCSFDTHIHPHLIWPSEHFGKRTLNLIRVLWMCLPSIIIQSDSIDVSFMIYWTYAVAFLIIQITPTSMCLNRSMFQGPRYIDRYISSCCICQQKLFVIVCIAQLCLLPSYIRICFILLRSN